MLFLLSEYKINIKYLRNKLIWAIALAKANVKFGPEGQIINEHWPLDDVHLPLRFDNKNKNNIWKPLYQQIPAELRAKLPDIPVKLKTYIEKQWDGQQFLAEYQSPNTYKDGPKWSKQMTNIIFELESTYHTNKSKVLTPLALPAWSNFNFRPGKANLFKDNYDKYFQDTEKLDQLIYPEYLYKLLHQTLEFSDLCEKSRVYSDDNHNFIYTDEYQFILLKYTNDNFTDYIPMRRKLENGKPSGIFEKAHDLEMRNKLKMEIDTCIDDIVDLANFGLIFCCGPPTPEVLKFFHVIAPLHFVTEKRWDKNSKKMITRKRVCFDGRANNIFTKDLYFAMNTASDILEVTASADYMISIDNCKSFYSTILSQGLVKHFGFIFQGLVWASITHMFGATWGPFCNELTQQVVILIIEEQFKVLKISNNLRLTCSWIDDSLLLLRLNTENGIIIGSVPLILQIIMGKIMQLGISVSIEKTEPIVTTNLKYLGIDFDLENKTYTYDFGLIEKIKHYIAQIAFDREEVKAEFEQHNNLAKLSINRKSVFQIFKHKMKKIDKDWKIQVKALQQITGLCVWMERENSIDIEILILRFLTRYPLIAGSRPEMPTFWIKLLLRELLELPRFLLAQFPNKNNLLSFPWALEMKIIKKDVYFLIIFEQEDGITSPINRIKVDTDLELLFDPISGIKSDMTSLQIWIHREKPKNMTSFKIFNDSFLLTTKMKAYAEEHYIQHKILLFIKYWFINNFSKPVAFHLYNSTILHKNMYCTKFHEILDNQKIAILHEKCEFLNFPKKWINVYNFPDMEIYKDIKGFSPFYAIKDKVLSNVFQYKAWIEKTKNYDNFTIILLCNNISETSQILRILRDIPKIKNIIIRLKSLKWSTFFHKIINFYFRLQRFSVDRSEWAKMELTDKKNRFSTKKVLPPIIPFLALRRRDQNSQLSFFTDGSLIKDKNQIITGMGIGIFSENLKIEFSKSVAPSELKKYDCPLSINSLELFAIFNALKIINDLHMANITLLTDSLYALNCMRYPINNDSVHYKIIKLIKNMSFFKFINFQYVKAHIGIFGNLEADKLAVMAARNTKIIAKFKDDSDNIFD